MRNHYQVIGNETLIFLKKRNGEILVSLIDTEDLDKLIKFDIRFYLWKEKNIDRYYVVGGENKTTVQMHRIIMDTPKGEVVDHMYGNTLDNRKKNLRNVSVSENMQNRVTLPSNNKSGVIGVFYSEKKKRWVVQVSINKKRKHVGYFINKEEAMEANLLFRKKHYSTPKGREAVGKPTS